MLCISLFATFSTATSNGSKRHKIKQPDPAGDKFDVESNPFENPVNFIGRDLEFPKLFLIPEPEGQKELADR